MRPARILAVGLPLVLALLNACVAPPPGPGADAASAGAPPPNPARAADRAAIRALAGVFEVTYDARETVALLPGYRVGPGNLASAREAVLLVEDTPDRLTLEHLLLIGDPPAIAKHWRQTWTADPQSRLLYEGDDTWSRERFPVPERSAWAVQVAEADERPSYEMVGRWQHTDAGVSTFTESRPSARPVSAREAAGPDASALLATTRLDVTPAGWAWTTDGETRRDRGPLARLLAVATYRPVVVGAEHGAGLASAERWWQRRGAFWDELRWAWHTRAASARYSIRPALDGEPLWGAAFALEESFRAAGPTAGVADLRAAIEALLDRYVLSP